MAMWELKKCPRCGGDMFIDKDIYGWYEKCLQCSYCSELRSFDEIQQSSVRKDKRPVGTLGHELRRR
jgi:DNA-directed RNA polymerase subunit M/transcription elongation factor TFIIS